MNQPITRIAKDDGLEVHLTFIPDADLGKQLQLIALQIKLFTPARTAEFVGLVQRALGTMEPQTSPDWAVSLMDCITGTPGPNNPRVVKYKTVSPTLTPTPSPPKDVEPFSVWDKFQGLR